MRNLLLAFGLGTFAMITAPACGGGGGGGAGGPGLSSGVDPTKSGEDVTTEEVTQICEAIGDYLQAKVDRIDVCRVAGVFGAAFLIEDSSATDADLQEACNVVVDNCRSEGAPPIDFDADEELSCEETDPLGECTATVGEVERCSQDLIDQQFGVFDVPSCSGLTRSYLESFGETPSELPASCQPLEDTCPELVTE